MNQENVDDRKAMIESINALIDASKIPNNEVDNVSQV